MYASDGLCLPCSTQTTRRCCRITLLEVDDRTSTLGHAADPRGISDGAKRVAAYSYWIDTGASWYGQTRNKEITVRVPAGYLPHARAVVGFRDANDGAGWPHGSAGRLRPEVLLGDGGDGAERIAAIVDTGTRLRSCMRRSSWPSAFFVRSRVIVSLINPTHCAIPCGPAADAYSQEQSVIDLLHTCSMVASCGSHAHLPAVVISPGVVPAQAPTPVLQPLHSCLHSAIIPTHCRTSCGTRKRRELLHLNPLTAPSD